MKIRLTARAFRGGKEDSQLTGWYRALARARSRSRALRCGELSFIAAREELLVFARTSGEETVAAAANRGETARTICLAWPKGGACDLLNGQALGVKNETLTLTLAPKSAKLIGISV